MEQTYISLPPETPKTVYTVTFRTVVSSKCYVVCYIDYSNPHKN